MCELLEPLVGNTDGERSHPDCPAAVLHQHGRSVHPAAQTSPAAVDEVDAIVLDVKTDEVTAQDALEDEVVPGEYLDHVPGREGNVEEESNLARNVLLLRYRSDGCSCQHEMVVMDPHNRNVIRVLWKLT